MTDDYEAYLEEAPEEEEEYTGRPIPYSDKFAGAAHATGCRGYDSEEGCICMSLWEAKYRRQLDEEAEELHAEYWT